MGVKFFVNWELWEQLTFVLAAGIVAVFIIGWIKLWWSNRLLKKYAILDEEKRVRQMEMRKSGLPVGRRIDIPFGVRAIQSGVEVEGIWISRPATPVEARSASKASTAATDSEGEPKPLDKGKGVMGKPMPTPTVAEAESSSRPNPSFILPGNPVDQNARHFNATPQPDDNANRSHLDVYVPTSSGSSVNSSRSPRVRPAGDRMSTSSEENLNLAATSPRQPPEARGRAVGYSPYYRNPADESRASSSAGPSTRSKYSSRLRAEMRGYPYEAAAAEHRRTPSLDRPPTAQQFSLASTRPVPVRTYTDQRETTAPRKVNPGFEVLPAGTFGRPSGENRQSTNDGSPGIAK